MVINQGIAKNAGFSIVEILFAVTLFATVFVWIQAMMSSSDSKVRDGIIEEETRFISQSAETCLRSIWYSALVSNFLQTGSLSFWTNQNSCLTGGISPKPYTFSWIQIHYENPGNSTEFREYHDLYFVSTGSEERTFRVTNIVSPEDPRIPVFEHTFVVR